MKKEVIQIASSVVINIGTMNSNRIELFLKAGKLANKYNKPVLLDPVGVFATKTRANLVKRLINEVNFTVIKGNISEIKYIAGLKTSGQGVDSNEDGLDLREEIKAISNKLNATVVATGKVDFVSNGVSVIEIYNGTEKLKRVTGTGCMTGSLIASYLGVTEKSIEAAAMGVLTMSLGGQLADKNNPPIGTFKVNLINEIYEMNIGKLEEMGKLKW